MNPCDNNNNNNIENEDEKIALSRRVNWNLPTTVACSLLFETGPCLADFPRFGFKPNTGICIEFSYGGCQGNENNFETKEACENTCIPFPASTKTNPEDEEIIPSEINQPSCDHTCFQPLETGPCRADFPSVGFQPDTGECTAFVYGGCQGNNNRFDTKDECENNCGGCPQEIKTEPSACNEDVCFLPFHTGHCRGYFPMYTFMPDTGLCVSFIYGGGTAGNGNRFENRRVRE
mmetsp:Transcript_23213/g.34269  ORF Transcript_23213/g.34269 Transcript_23213/m.34269 type:complete len:233 (-) Transcript_23213:568-1266(-)